MPPSCSQHYLTTPVLLEALFEPHFKPLTVSHLGNKGRRTLTVECSGSNTPSRDARSPSLTWRRCSSEGEGVKCSGLPEGTSPCALLEGCTPLTPPAAGIIQGLLARTTDCGQALILLEGCLATEVGVDDAQKKDIRRGIMQVTRVLQG